MSNNSWIKISQDSRAILDGIFALARKIGRLGWPAHLPRRIGPEYVMMADQGATLKVRYYLVLTDRNGAVLVGVRVEEFKGCRWVFPVYLYAFDASNGEVLFRYPADWPPKEISVDELLNLDVVPAILEL